MKRGAGAPDPGWEPSSWQIVLSLIGFQLGWWASVLGVVWGHPSVGPVVVGFLLVLHLAFFVSRESQLRIALEVVVVGLVVDSLLSLAGVLSFSAGWGWIAPPWILAMWLNFALVLRVSLRWLQGRYLLGAILGAVGGPAAYWAGERLGAVAFGGSWIVSLCLLGTIWAGVVPLFLYRTFGGKELRG